MIGYQFHQLSDAAIIQFVKNIIQKQDRLGLFVAKKYLELGKLKRNYKRLLLTLGTEFF